MRKLTKERIGLNKVRNQISPSVTEFGVLQTKVDALVQPNIIEGYINTLNHPQVIHNDQVKTAEINLNTIKTVRIVMNSDDYVMTLTGGEEGKTLYFEFLNEGSYDLKWSNLRVQFGTNPGLSFKSPSAGSDPSITILEIVKLGNFYYLMNNYKQRAALTLPELQTKLNDTISQQENQIKVFSGRDSSGQPLSYSLGPNGGLFHDTIVSTDPNSLAPDYLFYLEVPKFLTDAYYSQVIAPIIHEVSPDITNYYIKLY